MGNINDVVQVSITRQTKTVSRQGFGTPLIIGSNCDFLERIRTYSSLSAVADDFEETDFEYKMADKIFAQDIHPTQIKIGRCGAPIKMEVSVGIANILNNTNYTVTLNGTAFTISSGVTATADSIVDALVTAINAGSEPVTAADNGNNFDLLADTAGIDFSIAVSKNLTLTSTSVYSEDISQAFNAIREEDDDFYFVLLTNKTKSQIKDLADSVESAKKMLVACSFDSDIKTTSTTDIASILSAAKYDRVHLISTGYTDTAIDAGWVSIMAPKTPGQATWKFKTITGITPENLTDTEITNLLRKNCNFYDTIGGTNITREGVVASGEYTDIIHGTDWIHVNVQAEVYDALMNQDKIPFTSSGIDVIRNKILAVLNRAAANGILKNDPAPSVSAPDITSISNSDKIARFLDNIGFTGFYQGAIHKTKISGNLSV